jgi:hypothetical protein
MAPAAGPRRHGGGGGAARGRGRAGRWGLLLLLLATAAAAPRAAAGEGRAVPDGDAAVWPAPLETPDGVPKLGLNVPYNEKYLDALRGPHRAADPSAVDRLLQSQQLWRRAMAPPQGGGGGAAASAGAADAAAGRPRPPQFSLMDCTPMFVHTKSWIDVLRSVTLRMYTCYSLCLDYPECTSTTPLARVAPVNADGGPAPPRLGAVVQCGLRVFRGDGGEFVAGDTILDVSGAGSGPVCTNTPPRARNYDGDGLAIVSERTPPAGGAGAGANVSLLARPGTQLADGLLVNVNDLWSNLEVKPLRLLNALPGSDYWTRLLVPLKGGLDLRESTRQLAGAVGGARTAPEEVKALWLLSGKVQGRGGEEGRGRWGGPGPPPRQCPLPPQWQTSAPPPAPHNAAKPQCPPPPPWKQVNGDMSARFFHTLDAACPRWLSYPFFGAPAAAGMSVYSAYANSTGPCPTTLASLEKVGAFLAGIPTASTPAGACAAGGTAVSHPEFNVTTACGAAERVRAGVSAPVAMQATLAAVAEKVGDGRRGLGRRVGSMGTAGRRWLWRPPFVAAGGARGAPCPAADISALPPRHAGDDPRLRPRARVCPRHLPGHIHRRALPAGVRDARGRGAVGAV